jgi:hypothetical protein
MRVFPSFSWRVENLEIILIFHASDWKNVLYCTISNQRQIPTLQEFFFNSVLYEYIHTVCTDSREQNTCTFCSSQVIADFLTLQSLSPKK